MTDSSQITIKTTGQIAEKHQEQENTIMMQYCGTALVEALERINDDKWVKLSDLKNLLDELTPDYKRDFPSKEAICKADAKTEIISKILRVLK